MSSPATANGAGGQGKSRTARRREWWTKNKVTGQKDFKLKLRDRTALGKKENERQQQTQPAAVAAAASRVDTSRGFRSSAKAAATAAVMSKSRKPLVTPTSKRSSPPQKATKPSAKQHSSSNKPHSKVVDKKKPKVVPKAQASQSSSPPKQAKAAAAAAAAAATAAEKAEDCLKPEMISEISMNAYGVDLMSGAVNHVPQRFILFVGNLPFTVNKGQLMSHFRKTGGVKHISIAKDKSGRPKGFAYIEFKDRISHGIALRLHHTTLGGRRINVEFSTSEAKKREAKDQKPQTS